MRGEELGGDDAAHRIADDVGLADLEVIQQADVLPTMA